MMETYKRSLLSHLNEIGKGETTMSSIYTSNYDIYFATRDDALDVLLNARSMASDLGRVTLANIRALAGLDYKYTDTRTWWTYDSLRHTGVAKLSGGYGIMLPPPSSRHSKVMYTEYRPSQRYAPKPTVEPISIVIHTGEVDDPGEVIADVFKYAYTIKDRMVNISIM